MLTIVEHKMKKKVFFAPSRTRTHALCLLLGVMIGYQQGAAHLAAGPQGLTGLKSTLTNPDGSQCSTQENGKEMNEIEAPKVNNPETINPNEVSSSKGMQYSDPNLNSLFSKM